MSCTRRPFLKIVDCTCVQSASASADCVYVHTLIAPASVPKMHVGTVQAWTLVQSRIALLIYT
eukprot:11187240-Lingulodinium_polyedra.AAC.1